MVMGLSYSHSTTKTMNKQEKRTPQTSSGGFFGVTYHGDFGGGANIAQLVMGMLG